MEKKKIVFVGHCILNTASKVTRFVKKSDKEENNRKEFLKFAIENNIHIIQLPCPEFNIYGASRWGHANEQFDNPFFRRYCTEMLEPYILQMKEYTKEKDKFQVIGVIGINGSPSCGIDITCSGPWGGEFSGRDNLSQVLSSIHIVEKKGVFMDVLEKMMKNENINLPMIDLKDAKSNMLKFVEGEHHEDNIE